MNDFTKRVKEDIESKSEKLKYIKEYEKTFLEFYKPKNSFQKLWLSLKLLFNNIESIELSTLEQVRDYYKKLDISELRLLKAYAFSRENGFEMASFGVVISFIAVLVGAFLTFYSKLLTVDSVEKFIGITLLIFGILMFFLILPVISLHSQRKYLAVLHKEIIDSVIKEKEKEESSEKTKQ